MNGAEVRSGERVAPRALCAELYVRDRRQTGESLSCLSGGSMAEGGQIELRGAVIKHRVVRQRDSIFQLKQRMRLPPFVDLFPAAASAEVGARQVRKTVEL